MNSLQPCFVLHQRPYRETSTLLEVFAAEHGRVGLVAKGARRARSPFRGLLQPFAPLLLSWSARGELGTLIGAELAGLPSGLRGRQIFHAWYLNELLMRLLHRHDPHPQLYASYARTLDGLAASSAQDIETVLRGFEVSLLEAIGYGMVLDHAVDTGQPLQAETQYRYLAERGPVAGDTSTDQDGKRLEADAEQHRGEAGLAVSGRTLLWLAGAASPGPDTGLEAKRLIRFVLRPLLGERPLATRLLFTRPSRDHD